MMMKLLAALALLLMGAPVMAQNYNPRETFAPLDLGQPVNRYRSANGMPGPDYWQNRADYAIRATLDTKAKAIRGTVRLAYTNHSPDTLDVLWLHREPKPSKTHTRGH